MKMLNHVLQIIIVHQTFFHVCNGVRQGVNLTLFLFSTFLNDLESFFENRDIFGLKTVTADIKRQLNVFLKIFCILYADHTVLMTESPNELQSQLDIFSWCPLSVNFSHFNIFL